MARGPIGLVVAAVLLFGAGVGVGAYVLGDAGRAPCWKVQEEVDGLQRTVSETFGADEEGQVALDQIAGTMENYPNCFSPAARESIAKMADLEPSSSGTDEAVPATATASESVSEP
jgi:hypothetical protein